MRRFLPSPRHTRTQFLTAFKDGELGAMIIYMEKMWKIYIFPSNAVNCRSRSTEFKVTMPYLFSELFGFSHKPFLILMELNSGSRVMTVCVYCTIFLSDGTIKSAF